MLRLCSKQGLFVFSHFRCTTCHSSRHMVSDHTNFMYSSLSVHIFAVFFLRSPLQSFPSQAQLNLDNPSFFRQIHSAFRQIFPRMMLRVDCFMAAFFIRLLRAVVSCSNVTINLSHKSSDLQLLLMLLCLLLNFYYAL